MKKIVLVLVIAGIGVGAYFLFFCGNDGSCEYESGALLRIDVSEGDKYNMVMNITTNSDIYEDNTFMEMVMSYEVMEEREGQIDFNLSIPSIKMNGFSEEMGGDFSYDSQNVGDDEFSQVMNLAYSSLLNTTISNITVSERGEIINESNNSDGNELIESMTNSDSFIVFPENKLEIGNSFIHVDLTTNEEFTYTLDTITSDEYMFKFNALIDGTEINGTAGYFKSSCMASSAFMEMSQNGINVKVESKTKVITK